MAYEIKITNYFMSYGQLGVPIINTLLWIQPCFGIIKSPSVIN